MAVTRPHIGKMRQVVKFERNDPTQLGAGKKDHFVELVTTRGELRKLSGHRALSFGEANIDNTWELKIRFQDALNNYLSKSLQVVIDNMFFSINTYEWIDQKQRYIRFILNQKF